jgi:hypothetical protein
MPSTGGSTLASHTAHSGLGAPGLYGSIPRQARHDLRDVVHLGGIEVRRHLGGIVSLHFARRNAVRRHAKARTGDRRRYWSGSTRRQACSHPLGDASIMRSLAALTHRKRDIDLHARAECERGDDRRHGAG